jgi:hypothetical protein
VNTRGVILEVEILQLPNGAYRVTVNGVSHEFTTLYEAFWILKEAAERKTRELQERGR